MTADNITVERIQDLRELLAVAVESMETLWLDLEMGDATTEYAAAVIDDMMTNLNSATR